MISPPGIQAWRGSTEGVQDALVDMWLLGECDQLVLSPGSTFGRSAHQVNVPPHPSTPPFGRSAHQINVPPHPSTPPFGRSV
eukprot:6026503-Pyramimonas_sp.AAC.1